MSDGKGCMCGAYGDYECGCEDVDWRSAREVELEAENARLREALVKVTESDYPYDVAFQALGRK